MKKILLLALVAIIGSVTAAYAKKNSSSDKPEGERIVLKAAADFNAILLNAPVTVEMVKDVEHPGFIVYHSTVKGELKVYNKGSKLVIGVKDECKKKELHVTSRVVVCYDGDIDEIVVNGSGDVLAKRLESKNDMQYVVNGSGDIKVADVFTSGKFDAIVNGSGDIDMRALDASEASATVNGSGDIEIKSVKATDVTASVNGSGDLTVKGTTINAVLSVNGSGDVSAGSLKAENVSVSGSGSGDVSCRASSSLSVKVGKSCDVHVHGPRPASVSINSNADNVHFSEK